MRQALWKAATDSAATRRSTLSATLYPLFPPTFLRSSAATFTVSLKRAIYSLFWREEEGWSSSFRETTVQAPRHQGRGLHPTIWVIRSLTFTPQNPLIAETQPVVHNRGKGWFW